MESIKGQNGLLGKFDGVTAVHVVIGVVVVLVVYHFLFHR